MNLLVMNIRLTSRFVFTMLGFGLIGISCLGNVSADQGGLTSKQIHVNAEGQARIYRNPEERREAGLGTELNDWLKFSGLLELEKEYLEDNLRNNKKIRDYGNTTPNIQIALELEMTSWFGAELVYEAEDDGDQQSTGWDEAFIYFDFDDLGLGVELGRVSTPFGAYYSHFVTGPLLEFGETIRDGIIIDYSILDSLEMSVFAIDSKTEKQNKNIEYDWGAGIEYVSATESFRFGISYLSDLSESDVRFLRENNDIYQERVSAWNAYVLLGFDKFEITSEVTEAVGRFREFDIQEDRPQAYNIELAYYPNQKLQFALRYEGSDEFADEPEKQYGANVTWRPVKRMSLSLDYLHGEYKNNFVFDDDDLEIEDRDLFATRVSVEF